MPVSITWDCPHSRSTRTCYSSSFPSSNFALSDFSKPCSRASFRIFPFGKLKTLHFFRLLLLFCPRKLFRVNFLPLDFCLTSERELNRLSSPRTQTEGEKMHASPLGFQAREAREREKMIKPVLYSTLSRRLTY